MLIFYNIVSIIQFPKGDKIEGSNVTYEAAMCTATRDFCIASQLKFSQLDGKRKWSEIVRLIRVLTTCHITCSTF